MSGGDHRISEVGAYGVSGIRSAWFMGSAVFLQLI
jgi:hypothetical protein